MKKVLLEVETTWGFHEVVTGSGKYAGKFIAKSTGANGAKGYFAVYDREEDAVARVQRETKPLPLEDKLSW